MQNQFDKNVQEIVVWNKTHTEYHIADIALHTNKEKYVLEFQHSTILQKEFISRSKFYTECGYNVIWIFDFCECKSYKRILIAEEYEDNIVRLVWPGNDRIRFLDNINLTDFNEHLQIFFHINTGKGKLQLHDPDGYYPWNTWEYVDPFSKFPCFALLNLVTFDSSNAFFAKLYSEKHFYHAWKRLETQCK